MDNYDFYYLISIKSDYGVSTI